MPADGMRAAAKKGTSAYPVGSSERKIILLSRACGKGRNRLFQHGKSLCGGGRVGVNSIARARGNVGKCAGRPRWGQDSLAISNLVAGTWRAANVHGRHKAGHVKR